MYYSDLVKKAAQISFEAHNGDTDKMTIRISASNDSSGSIR